MAAFMIPAMVNLTFKKRLGYDETTTVEVLAGTRFAVIASPIFSCA